MNLTIDKQLALQEAIDEIKQFLYRNGKRLGHDDVRLHCRCPMCKQRCPVCCGEQENPAATEV